MRAPSVSHDRTDATTPAGSPLVTQAMTVVIQRLVAGYAVLGLLPGLPALLVQSGSIAWWWLGPVCLGFTVVVLGMVAQAARSAPLQGWAAGFAVLTLLAVATMPAAVPGQLTTEQPWLWWHVGLAVVCAGVWGGFRTAVAYGVVLGVAWAVLRWSTSGQLRVALTESVFAIAAGLVVAVLAVGMLASAAAADELAGRLSAGQLQEAVDKAVGEERARLDQLIHDDVMTTLTSAAYAGDAVAGRATAGLARETLARIDALPTSGGQEGSISPAVLGTLAAQTVLRVSPDVGYAERIDPAVATSRLPAEVAETVLAALREAVRNAVRHAAARHVDVALTAARTGSELRLVASVVDDGRGFDPSAVPADRLGVRVSMLDASTRSGVGTDLVSRPGGGTTFTLAWAGRAGAALERRPLEPAVAEDRLPAAFPVGRFTAVVWVGVVVSAAGGLANLDLVRAVPPVLVAMVAVLVGTAVLLLRTERLQLSRSAAWASVCCLAVAVAAMDAALPSTVWPDLALWHAFPTQLMLVILVVRRRVAHALAGLVVVELALGWWSFRSAFGLDGLLRVGLGHALFVAMALLLTQVLRTVGRRQAALRHREDQAIDDSVRRHVALVQRSLWVADLKAQARATLVRLAEVGGPVPPPLRYDALLLEATLRESLVARNVMSDELAVLTENARRRGVDVRIVDSRHTVVPQAVSQALLDAVRRALAPETVTRLVVRLAPEDGASPATVLAEDADGTHLVTLGQDGVGAAREVRVRER